MGEGCTVVAVMLLCWGLLKILSVRSGGLIPLPCQEGGSRLNFPMALIAHSAFMVRGLRFADIFNWSIVIFSDQPTSFEVSLMKLSISLTLDSKWS